MNATLAARLGREEPSSPPAEAPGLPVDLTVADYVRMVDEGWIPEGRRIFLWRGQLYEKMAKTTAHAATHSCVLDALVRAIPRTWHVTAEGPLEIARTSMPLPDLMVLRGRPQEYLGRYPKVRDVGLVVEVAVHSLKVDLGEFARDLARAGVPRYWVVDALGWTIHTHEGLAGRGRTRRYAEVRERAAGERLALPLDDLVLELSVDDLLPPRPRDAR